MWWSGNSPTRWRYRSYFRVPTQLLGGKVPEIVNSDQGSHFTSRRFTERFLSAGSRVSMDGRGRFTDNIFTERLWRTLKYEYEEVYLTEYETPRQTRQGVGKYLAYYNEQRPHQALDYKTPAQIYRTKQPDDQTQNCLSQ